MQIRELRLEELPQVLSLIDEFDRTPASRPNPDALARTFAHLEEAGGCVLGAVLEGRIIGTCTLNICPNLSWSCRPYGIIENVIVSAGHRKQGIGKRLLKKAEQLAKAKDCYKLALMTGSRQIETLSFYQSCGFVGNKTGFQMRFNS